MNYAIVFRLLGYVMLIEGALLLLPAAASWIYGEWFVLGVFLITAAVSAAIGYALRGIKPQSKVFYMREGFATTALCWLLIRPAVQTSPWLTRRSRSPRAARTTTTP